MTDKTNANEKLDASVADAETTRDTGMPPTPRQAKSSSAHAPTDLPAIPPLTPEETAELRAKAHAAEEHWDRYLRAASDLENYKKRVARERQEMEKYKHEPLLRDLLPVLDSLEIAFAVESDGSGKALEAMKTGVTMISQQLKSVLSAAGLEEVDAAGKPFDPMLHEAVAQQESAEVPEGHVVRQLRKGYKYREHLLRPASVFVARKPAA